MALKIVRAADPIAVERINLCLYGAPGLGKTSLAFTAEQPLLLDFDRGVYRAPNRKDSVPVESWADVESMSADDLAPYKTIIIDTAGRALDALALDIIRQNPKMGSGGTLTWPGFGQLKSRFAGFLRLLNESGKDVVLIAHMDEQRNGTDVIERLDAQGASKNEIYKSADAMGRVLLRGGKRYLDFSPREGSFGKNPAQLPELLFPHPSQHPHFLADTIARIKDALNQMSAEQLAQQAQIEDWALAIREMETVEDFNHQLPAIRQAPKAVQALFARAAKAKGFVANKATHRYEVAAHEPEPVHA